MTGELLCAEGEGKAAGKDSGVAAAPPSSTKGG